VGHELLPSKDQTTEGESSQVGCALPALRQTAAVKYVHLHVSMNPYSLISTDTFTTLSKVTRKTDDHGSTVINVLCYKSEVRGSSQLVP